MNRAYPVATHKRCDLLDVEEESSMRFYADGMKTRPFACWGDWVGLGAWFFILGVLLCLSIS